MDVTLASIVIVAVALILMGAIALKALRQRRTIDLRERLAPYERRQVDQGRLVAARRKERALTGSGGR